MKYFTPELYLRIQDTSSDEAMDAADAAWEKAAQRYRRCVQRVLPQLPAGLRSLIEDFHLHDADILSMGHEGQRFFIVLRLDVPPHETLLLDYQLAQEAAIDRNAFASLASGPVQWMYDEINLVRGRERCFLHSLLLSNGWEIQLRLRDLKVSRAQTLFPAPGTNLVPVSAAWTRSA